MFVMVSLTVPLIMVVVVVVVVGYGSLSGTSCSSWSVSPSL